MRTTGTALWTRPAGGPRFTRIRGVAAEDALSLEYVPGPRRGASERDGGHRRVHLLDGFRPLPDGRRGDRGDAGEFKAPAPTPPDFCWRLSR